ncbi:MAG: ribonuclease P/MRP protein subunit POP5 [Candidatus Nanohaloarchaea archaeon]|jgi:ribonuclease P/MRP protein subunit POP5
MKPLPPSIREKKRYLKFKVHAEEPVNFGELSDSVWGSCLSYLGSKRTGEANHWLIKNQFNRSDQTGVIKVEKSCVEDFRAALTLVDKIGDKKSFIEVKRVSGSIKKLKDS